MELEPPRFGGAFLAVITVVLLGFASAFFGVALSNQMASSSVAPSNIISVTEASEAVQGGRVRRGVMTERVRNDPWVTAAR